ncbi:zona pellucida sperm-binding protein 3-like isoform X2 [Poeciliopsis prolifica]|uniref:zona pellucida sperm-binding protein 3-like isoform X2 n=1 Tax=Poeciliopsis prolifica TaxID=188132 RepID=UPI0024132F44|nr:zona pellucida sperm-binding protein 3-like isoform X2 [Poeciliopsis prolifica]
MIFCDAKPVKPPRPPPLQHQQQLQIFEKELTWKYPDDPQPDPTPNVPSDPKYPVTVPAAAVAVECRESIAHVEAKKDLFGIGQPINPNDLILGNCPPTGEDPVAQVLIYEVELHKCGSQLTTTDDALIYTYSLNYSPSNLGISPILRPTQAVIVECHYPRKHNVSSLPLEPLWVPYAAVKMAEEFLYFTMKLMTDDWLNERPSYQYFLGDLIRIEVTVKQYLHTPLRVYVDRCVATISPDATSSPNYAFIDNFGCMVDAWITVCDSRFMARTEENKLQFQLEAFRFQNPNSGLIYITCHLKATSTAHPIDGQHRACSYIGGWREASGNDPACASCESGDVEWYGSPGISFSSTGGQHTPGDPNVFYHLPFSRKRTRDVTQPELLEWEGDVTLGPIPVMEKKL